MQGTEAIMNIDRFQGTSCERRRRSDIFSAISRSQRENQIICFVANLEIFCANWVICQRALSDFLEGSIRSCHSAHLFISEMTRFLRVMVTADSLMSQSKTNKIERHDGIQSAICDEMRDVLTIKSRGKFHFEILGDVCGSAI
jgi:hypothetical protein